MLWRGAALGAGPPEALPEQLGTQLREALLLGRKPEVLGPRLPCTLPRASTKPGAPTTGHMVLTQGWVCMGTMSCSANKGIYPGGPRH